MIGDRWKDVACGAAAGCTTVFVDYAYAEQFQGPSPSHVCRSVASGLDYILKRANSTA
jgi:D-glycero-D-manno-heptose 1,7-bisphosphate phosphatase